MSFERNLQSETVDHCYPVEPLCLAPSAPAAQAMREMQARNCGAVLVCQDSGVVGIFTERDALAMMAAGDSFDVPLAQVMTADPVLIRARDTVGRAITLMTQGGYRRIPIVDDRGRPLGIITAEGIMHYLAEHFPGVIYNLPPEPHHVTQSRKGA